MFVIGTQVGVYLLYYIIILLYYVGRYLPISLSVFSLLQLNKNELIEHPEIAVTDSFW